MSQAMPLVRVGGATVAGAAVGFMIGGPAGAWAVGETAFTIAARSEIVGLAINAAAGKEIAAGIDLAIEKLWPIMQADTNVTEAEARACVAGLLTTALLASDFKGLTNQLKTVGQVAGKTALGQKVNSTVLNKDFAETKKSDLTSDFAVKDKVEVKSSGTTTSISKEPIKDVTTDVKPVKVDVPIKPIYVDKTVKIGEYEFPIKPVNSMEKLSKPTKQGSLYQERVAELYFGETRFPQKYGSQVGDTVRRGEADFAFLNTERKPIAVEAKYIDKWDKSSYNPNYTKDRPFLIKVSDTDVLSQARKYQNSNFHEIIYHTNSPEFAAFYKDLFHKEGLTKIRFVISPVELIKK